MNRDAHLLGGLALSLILASGAAQATLIDRDNGMIYDIDRNITWVSDANLFDTLHASDPALTARVIADVHAVSHGRTTHTLTTADFSTAVAGHQSGLMSWWGAMACAQDLVFVGFDDWWLPTSLQPDRACSQQSHINANDSDVSQGTGCTGRELGHLSYDELGGSANADIRVVHNASCALCSDVRTDDWTGTPFTVSGLGDASWSFTPSDGKQRLVESGSGGDGAISFAWIVRSGDVRVTLPPNGVPEPGTVSLLFAAIGATSVVGRRWSRLSARKGNY